MTPPSPYDGDTSPLCGEERSCPPHAQRGEVSAQRTEGPWGVSSVEAPIHFRPLQGFEDGLEDDRGPGNHIAIPEAQHAKPARSQKGVSARVIVGLLDVLASVQFDDDGRLHAGEIADVGSHQMLATKP